MRTWEIVCSTDGNMIDHIETVKSDNEPGFWDCQEIAQNNDCEFWYVEEIR